MGGDEVLQHRQALTEVRLDWPRDDLTLWVCHEPAHTGDLSNLHHISAGTGVNHDEYRVGPREVLLHGLGNFVSCARPDLDKFLTALRVGNQTTLVLLLNLVGFLLGCT